MSDIQLELETMIDTHGLSQVLEWLSQICYEKAEHVRTNWQDESLARTWDNNASGLQVVNAYVRDQPDYGTKRIQQSQRIQRTDCTHLGT